MRRASTTRHKSEMLFAARTRLARGLTVLFFLTLVALLAASHASARPLTPPPPPQTELTPLQREIQKQKARLSSADMEERRDALMRLGSMARPESSRVAAAALGDPSAIIRATAARAVLSLDSGEAARLVLPLLGDRDEFVRREAAYALGLSRSRDGVSALAAAVESDKKPSVRGAAAVALGQIADPAAVPALTGALSRRLPAAGFLNRVRRRKVEEDEFVRRAAAVALGQLKSRDAVPALVEALSDEGAPADVRREAARALGLIGDPSAAAALRGVLTARDPYLARAAYESLLKIDPQSAKRPG